MRTTLIVCALALTSVTTLNAQSNGAMGKTVTPTHGCMMMSDSMSTALGLSTEQVGRVKESDDRCMKACEKAAHPSTGKMDEAAMQQHDADMQKILTTAQYTKWSTQCNTSRAQGTMNSPVK